MKIKDRLLLGLVAGLGANIPKLLLGRAAMKMKMAEMNGPEIAAGIFVPGHQLTTIPGKVIGYIADATISGILGATTVYALSFTGKNSYVLKGAVMGQIMWQGLYVILGSFGGSQVKPGTPKTILAEFVNHTVFGITAATIAANLGDEALFSGKLPMSASAPSQDQQQPQTRPGQGQKGSSKGEPEAEPTYLTH
jgi:hypothetical protein